ncbi:MAG TPA: monofunctional biosynthetic peptidoglycan transglycosylase [Aestuariivirgaceae bacterium]|jgi:monofunctional glycosyltransferase|nr:monofunctional biosynthetic peptidoglycan transglycosylase [Aestuariivirgaceae bacterium]
MANSTELPTGAGSVEFEEYRGPKPLEIWLKRALITVGILVATPYFLAPIYRFVPPPVSATMLWNALDGEKINYSWRPIEEISPRLVRAVVTSEDARVCLHHGVDWEVLSDLFDEMTNGETATVRGGSTITMQVAKNLFLWPYRSYVRKALEIPLASWIDLLWGKRRVVEVYLNVAEWGPGIYGAEAAAQHHFKKSAAALSTREAVLLAAALPNPIMRRAGRPGNQLERMAGRLRRKIPGSITYLDCLDQGGTTKISGQN